MPTVISETDTFPATIQRPSNGELADSASLAQFADALAKRARFLYNRGRSSLFDITRAPYGADPTGVADSTAAIQAAIDAAAPSSGDVFIPDGNFKRGTLVIPSRVNIIGVPGGGSRLWKTGGGNGLVYTDPNTENPSVVSDICFGSDAVDTGTEVVNNAEARVIFLRCSWNAVNDNLQGKIASLNATYSWVQFVDCDIKVVGNVRGVDVTLGRAEMIRGSLTMPGTYSEALFYADFGGDAELNDVRVDCSAHSVGTSYMFVAMARGQMIGCKVNGQAAIATTGLWWEEGARVVAKANDWNMSIYFNPYGPNLAGIGSHVDLLPSLAVNAGAVTAINSSIYGAVAHTSLFVRNASTSATTISLPQGILPGQVLHFTYFHDAVSAVAISFTGIPVTAYALPGSSGSPNLGTLGAGNTMSGTFVWETRDVGSSVSYRWIQVGTWGVGLTLV